MGLRGAKGCKTGKTLISQNRTRWWQHADLKGVLTGSQSSLFQICLKVAKLVKTCLLGEVE